MCPANGAADAEEHAWQDLLEHEQAVHAQERPAPA